MGNLEGVTGTFESPLWDAATVWELDRIGPVTSDPPSVDLEGLSMFVRALHVPRKISRLRPTAGRRGRSALLAPS